MVRQHLPGAPTLRPSVLDVFARASTPSHSVRTGDPDIVIETLSQLVLRTGAGSTDAALGRLLAAITEAGPELSPSQLRTLAEAELAAADGPRMFFPMLARNGEETSSSISHEAARENWIVAGQGLVPKDLMAAFEALTPGERDAALNGFFETDNARGALAMMDRFRDALLETSRVSRAEACAIAAGIDFVGEVKPAASAVMREALVDAIRLTNGRIAGHLREIFVSNHETLDMSRLATVTVTNTAEEIRTDIFFLVESLYQALASPRQKAALQYPEDLVCSIGPPPPHAPPEPERDREAFHMLACAEFMATQFLTHARGFFLTLGLLGS
ncbi:MAG: hypothetical protein ACKVPX_08085 [Myxococcaceae bacterium]